MNDFLFVQSYGIHLWDDFLGTLSFVIILMMLSILPSASVFKKYWTMGSFAASSVASLTVLPRAIMRLDPATFVYHAIWVAVGIWVVATFWKPSWEERVARMEATQTRFGIWLAGWVSDNVTHRGRRDGEHERL